MSDARPHVIQMRTEFDKGLRPRQWFGRASGVQAALIIRSKTFYHDNQLSDGSFQTNFKLEMLWTNFAMAIVGLAKYSRAGAKFQGDALILGTPLRSRLPRISRMQTLLMRCMTSRTWRSRHRCCEQKKYTTHVVENTEHNLRVRPRSP